MKSFGLVSAINCIVEYITYENIINIDLNMKILEPFNEVLQPILLTRYEKVDFELLKNLEKGIEGTYNALEDLYYYSYNYIELIKSNSPNMMLNMEVVESKPFESSELDNIISLKGELAILVKAENRERRHYKNKFNTFLSEKFYTNKLILKYKYMSKKFKSKELVLSFDNLYETMNSQNCYMKKIFLYKRHSNLDLRKLFNRVYWKYIDIKDILSKIGIRNLEVFDFDYLMNKYLHLKNNNPLPFQIVYRCINSIRFLDYIEKYQTIANALIKKLHYYIYNFELFKTKMTEIYDMEMYTSHLISCNLYHKETDKILINIEKIEDLFKSLFESLPEKITTPFNSATIIKGGHGSSLAYKTPAYFEGPPLYYKNINEIDEITHIPVKETTGSSDILTLGERGNAVEVNQNEYTSFNRDTSSQEAISIDDPFDYLLDFNENLLQS